MIYLIAAIACTLCLFTGFKLFAKYGINTFQAIVVNYITCVATGLIANIGSISISDFNSGLTTWLPFALAIGCGFIFTFNLMGTAVRKAGLAPATVAAKMSMVIPVTFALISLGKASEYGVSEYIGLALATASVFMVTHAPIDKIVTVQSQTKSEVTLVKKSSKWLPLILLLAVWALSGILDTSLNFVNKNYLTGASVNSSASFSISLFGVAALVGTITLISTCVFGSEKFQLKAIIPGIMLGIPNYFSVVFTLKALDAFNQNGAVVYPAINIGTIIASALLAIFLFKEKTTRLNRIGIVIACISILLLSINQVN